MSDHPPEYVASRFREWIIYSTGSAVIRAQYVERILNGICLMMRTQGLRFTQEDFVSGDSARIKQTLGMIREQLGNTGLFDEDFIERLRIYVDRRNRVVHGLYADSFHSDDEFEISSEVAQKYVKECEWLIHEGPELVEIGFGICRVMQEWVTPENPDYEEIVAMRHSFDEYYECGLDTIASELKPHLGKKS